MQRKVEPEGRSLGSLDSRPAKSGKERRPEYGNDVELAERLGRAISLAYKTRPRYGG